jgi:hypothetical protein
MDNAVDYSDRRTEEVGLWAQLPHLLEWDKTEMKNQRLIIED